MSDGTWSCTGIWYATGRPKWKWIPKEATMASERILHEWESDRSIYKLIGYRSFGYGLHIDHGNGQSVIEPIPLQELGDEILRLAAALSASEDRAKVEYEKGIERGYSAGMAAAEDRARRAWTPIENALPESGIPVIAWVPNRGAGGRRIRAAYAAPRTLEASLEADDGYEYDEETDTYWCSEGWYEQNEYEDIHWLVSDPVTHWIPLPDPPVAAAEDRARREATRYVTCPNCEGRTPADEAEARHQARVEGLRDALAAVKYEAARMHTHKGHLVDKIERLLDEAKGGTDEQG